MNTIPSIFNARVINYTVSGGGEVPDKVLFPVTCLVINRKNTQYKSRIYDNLADKGFAQIISVETNQKGISGELPVKDYPFVKFLVTRENVTCGDMINIGMQEAENPYVLVLPNELCEEKVQFTQTLYEKLVEKEQFCLVPRLFDSNRKPVPVMFRPESKKSVFFVEPDFSAGEGEHTLYAADFAGFYNRQKFIQLGGFDYTITSKYWQKLDLFFRAWLWGEKVTVASAMEFFYSSAVPDEDQSPDLSYLRFYLKNLVPVFKTDHAYIPVSSFFAFKLRNSCGLNESLSQFSGARKWTYQNRYRFKKDAVMLIEEWGK